MAVRLRLTRVGAKKNPIWRVVVADGRSPRDGRFIETIGQYNPQTEPSTIALDERRLEHWLERGAQPTRTVKHLIRARAKSARSAEAADVAAETSRAPSAPAAGASSAETPEAAAGTPSAEPAEAAPGTAGDR